VGVAIGVASSTVTRVAGGIAARVASGAVTRVAGGTVAGIAGGVSGVASSRARGIASLSKVKLSQSYRVIIIIGFTSIRAAISSLSIYL
jgi:hypothetical protein